MANLNKIVKIKLEDYSTLLSNGSVTIDGVTHTYNANNLYIIVDPSAPEYAETAGYADTAGSAGSAECDSDGNVIAPYVIDGGDDDDPYVANGTYDNITLALSDGRRVFVKVNSLSYDSGYLYIPLVKDNSSSDTYVFSGVIYDSSDAATNLLFTYEVNSSDGAFCSYYSLAPLDSPSFSGTPTAPTATTGTNTLQIATTAFVLKAIKDDYIITSSCMNYDYTLKEFLKTSGSGSWNAQAYSKSGYKECRLTYKIGLTGAAIMVGLNSDPSTDAGYGSIDYCWYMQNTTDKKLNIYESNSSISSITGHTTYAVGDEFVIEYSNGTVRYYHNGVLCRTVERAYGNPLYFDSSFHGLGYIYDVVFEPIGISLAWDNISGKPSTFTPSSHTHGNIQNGGTLQTNDVAPANGDKLVITDASDSNKVARSSISIGSAVTTQSQSTKFLREDGTWAAPSYTGVTSGYWANIGVTTSANYIKEPELKSIKINGSSTNAASTTNCSLLYDPTYKYLKFVFV